jgi:hypothetical protein
MAKRARRDMRAKAERLAGTDPHRKVDASSWTPNEPLNADRKTGARPIRPRIYKIGGKVQGDRAPRDPGRSARASGGRTETGPLSMANVPAENARDLGSFHIGGYKNGGSLKAGIDMADIKKAVHAHDRQRHEGQPLTKLARGGRAKSGKTNINIVITQPKADQPQLPPQGVVRPPVPPIMPPSMPPGGAPPMGAGPPGGLAPPMGPPPPMRARGGKVGHRKYRSAADMDAGALSGLGRLEKTEIQEHKR